MLSLGDAVGNKVAALFSRGTRDYLDVDAIRAGGRFDDAELVAAAAARDGGFDVAVFAQQLNDVVRISALDVRLYGVTVEQLQAVKARCLQWPVELDATGTSLRSDDVE